jgi:predicted ATP-dependent endonuclease of OLD family
MKLEKLSIENFKSIEIITFEINEINNTYTYSLLGINESGKSSFLKGISLKNKNNLKYPDDYFNSSNAINITFTYILTIEELKEIKKKLQIEHQFPKEILDRIVIEKINLITEFNPTIEVVKSSTEIITFKEAIYSNYTIKENIVSKKTIVINEENIEEDLNLNNFFNLFYNNYFNKISHNVVMWESSPEYLLLDEIDLLTFSKTPREISIPLLNCFILAGINENEIEIEIKKLTSPVAINSLQSKLSELITKHINDVWPEHPISIAFQIDRNKISLLIEDNGVKFQPKTTNQRSDGFKQFISFLLTISVESHNRELANTILLIDEPETHLHPPAQINLLKELIKITSNKNNNILFFATHSNYLIDKENLERNFKVVKEKNHKTKINQIPHKKSTYSEVNYEVFNIQTSDYHNELYGFIEFEDKSFLLSLAKTKKWIDSRNNNEKDISISEYIRHSIHHPENTLNKKYTDVELGDSITILRTLKTSIINTNSVAPAVVNVPTKTRK